MPAEREKLLDLDDPAQSASGGRPASEPAPRPTVIPKFDPEKFAEDSEIRERMPTLTDEAALEHARQLSALPSIMPGARASRPSIAPSSLMGPRDSHPDIDVGEDDIDSLGPEEQVALLRERLEPLSRVPVLRAHAGLDDPRTAYIAGFVDGVLPLETIIDVTGLPELDTLRVLDRLAAQGLVAFK